MNVKWKDVREGGLEKGIRGGKEGKLEGKKGGMERIKQGRKQ